MADKAPKKGSNALVRDWPRVAGAELDTIFSCAPDDRCNGLVNQFVPLTAGSVVAAYRHGVFPWGSNAALGTVNWHTPPYRGVLRLSDVAISRKDRSFIAAARKDADLQITINEDFAGVIEACASMPRHLQKTWISPDFIAAYRELHRVGIAHSVEVRRNGRLVGGLYGVDVEGVFSGESMFHLESDVTKLAFWLLIDRLRALGRDFIDTQMAVGLARKWGAQLIPRAEFEILRKQASLTFKPFT
jgi:leucyl/phenylalanyl-tRNA--protein transferase